MMKLRLDIKKKNCLSQDWSDTYYYYYDHFPWEKSICTIMARSEKNANEKSWKWGKILSDS